MSDVFIKRWLNSCLKKACWSQEHKAEKRAKELKKTTGLGFRHYKCSKCQKYHLTTKEFKVFEDKKND